MTTRNHALSLAHKSQKLAAFLVSMGKVADDSDKRCGHRDRVQATAASVPTVHSDAAQVVDSRLRHARVQLQFLTGSCIQAQRLLTSAGPEERRRMQVDQWPLLVRRTARTFHGDADYGRATDAARAVGNRNRNRAVVAKRHLDRNLTETENGQKHTAIITEKLWQERDRDLLFMGVTQMTLPDVLCTRNLLDSKY